MNGIQRSSDGMSPDKGPLVPPPYPHDVYCNQRTGKICSPQQGFQISRFCFLKIITITGVRKFIYYTKAFSRGSSYLGSTVPGHYSPQAGSIIINLSSSIAGV